MKKRIACKHLSLFLSILLLLGTLVGCQGAGDPSHTTGSTSGTEDPVATPEHIGKVFYGASLLTGTGILLRDLDAHGQPLRWMNIDPSFHISFVKLKNVYDSSNKLTQSTFQPVGDYYDLFNNYWMTYHYNDKNQLASVIYWTPSEIGYCFREVYTYDAQTGALKEKALDLNGDVLLRNRYDSNGMIREQVCVGEQILTYEYTASGNVARAFEYAADDTAHTQLVKTHIFTYNAEDQLTQYQAKDPSNTVLTEIRFTPGSTVFPTSALYTKDNAKYKFEHTYNAQGNLTQVLQWNAYGDGEWNMDTYGNYRFTYNDAGQVTQNTRLHNDNPVDIRYYSYNDAGQLIEEKKVIPRPEEEKLRNHSMYEFSSDGRLKKITYHVLVNEARDHEQIFTITIEQENGIPSRYVLEDHNVTANTTDYTDIRIGCTEENGVLRVTLTASDASGSPIEP